MDLGETSSSCFQQLCQQHCVTFQVTDPVEKSNIFIQSEYDENKNRI